MTSVLARKIENLAKRERRSQTALLSEMVQVYEDFRKDQKDLQLVERCIREAQEEHAVSPISAEEIVAESVRLAREGAKRAKQLGIKTDMASVNRRIHEQRKRRRSA